MDVKAPITDVKGIGSQTEKKMNRIGVYTVGDMLLHYPRDYVLYKDPLRPSELLGEGHCAVIGRLAGPPALKRTGRMDLVTARAGDAAGTVELVWFHMPYVRSQLKQGEAYIFYGRVKARGGGFCMEQPEIYTWEQYQEKKRTLQPVYAQTEGLSSKMIAKTMKKAFEELPAFEDGLPDAIRKKEELCEYHVAIRQIHFPNDMEHLMEARRRLVFDEFFFFILQLRSLKSVREKAANHFQIKTSEKTQALLANLPYKLTNAQLRVWKMIEQEMSGETVMARLIQGDVGSGKTIVSILALLMAADSGYQGALMVPTEVLARQHYTSLQELFAENGFPFEVVLLTGSMTAKQKREAYAQIASGEASVIVGTHALIQEKVVYQNLALVITDEQHRFGVRQRELLSMKGEMPHTIVMSATPIPRTLAVILYGDLDISVIDEMPSNRLPIKNCVVNTGYRKKAYEFIKNQVSQGHQAYVICPMVDESEAIEAEDVINYTEVLRRELPDGICVEYLHGKMKPSQKNEIMNRFLANEIQVLVSTTVVEVGVNVPNATVMMIENAERFGLAQLHQLRGRVGRGSDQSYCIFLHTMEGKTIRERLDILCNQTMALKLQTEICSCAARAICLECGRAVCLILLWQIFIRMQRCFSRRMRLLESSLQKIRSLQRPAIKDSGSISTFSSGTRVII